MSTSFRAHHHHDAPYALGRDNRRALEAPIALPGASRALSDASDVDCRRKLSILMDARDIQTVSPSALARVSLASLSRLSLSRARARTWHVSYASLPPIPGLRARRWRRVTPSSSSSSSSSFERRAVSHVPLVEGARARIARDRRPCAW